MCANLGLTSWALLMAAARHIPIEHANIKAGNKIWQSTIPIGLDGRTIGLVGLGKLGKSTAKVSVSTFLFIAITN